MLRIILTGFIVIAAYGCATPQPVVRLQPVSPDVVWKSGRAIVSRQTPAARVAVAFERMTEERVVFRVELQNLGPGRRDVGPHQFEYTACRTAGSCRATRRVIDPEARLLALDVNRSRARADQTNSATLGVGLLMLNAVTTVGAAAQGNSQLASDLADDGLALAATTSSTIDRQEHAITSIEAEQLDWAASALRRTTLGPDQGIAGLVHLPLDLEATRIWLGVTVDDRTLWFEFEQTVILVAPAAPG